jgi:tetratricopeptide (TPR) repeat protein
LGDITNDPTCYDKSIELSNGRFSNAFVSLASYYFQRGEIEKALDNYQKALRIRPLLTSIWFRVGTICMQLERWDEALQAFSEVVMQEPEDAEAWANVAAVHMHSKKPAEAYPALVQSLKYKRTNWRVWYSKLYTCLDLSKWDEGVQACFVLLDLRNERQAKDGIPPLEEKCIRGIVGGVLEAYKAGQDNPIVADSARRTLTRVHALLDRISTSSDAQPWVFEILAHMHSETGNYKELIDDLMKEYRALQVIPRWEMDDHIIRKIQQIVSQIVHIYEQDEQNMAENLNTSRFLIRGVIQKLDIARKQYMNTKMPEEYEKLKLLLINVEAKQKKLSS